MSSLDQTPSPRTIFDLPVALIVWTSFLLYGAIAAPVPAVNEPHYLCKALHYWQPDWCANDFFLQSSNAHTVFYATIGSLTQWMSFTRAAWIGRVIALIILTWGWCSLISLLLPSRWSPVLVAWLFLGMAACGSFSGEWLVGGVEGKVLSYGFLFGSLGQFQRGRTIAAGVLAGLAIAFHPVIGVWGMFAFSGTIVISWLLRYRSKGDPAANRPALIPSLLALSALTVCALPGLIPVFRLLSESVPQQTKVAATYIQVYYRLAHHLDPMRFSVRSYLGYAALLALWLISMRIAKRTASQRQFDSVVGFAILFALVGILIGWGPRPAQNMIWYIPRGNLLKFYPFRLADVLIPLAVAIATVRLLLSCQRSKCLFIGSVLIFGLALYRAPIHVEVNRYLNEYRDDWIDACRWIDEHLSADVLVHTPHNGWAFKWFARRAEYVAFKDCPQDAAGIVEWNRRLNFLKKWFEDHYADEFYSADELRDFRTQTKVTHIFTDRLGPLDLKPIFKNDTFQVYDLRSLDR